MTTYACLQNLNGHAYPASVTGLPPMQGLESLLDDAALAEKIAHARAIDAVLFIDFEATPPTFGTFPTKAQAKRATDFVEQLAALHGRCGVAADEPIGAFTGLPVGARWQYPQYRLSSAANAAYAKAGVLAPFTFTSAHAYLSEDDAPVTVAFAVRYVQRRIAAARLLGRPVVIFIKPTYEGSGDRIAAEVIRAMLDECTRQGVDVCIWQDGVTEAEASALVSELVQTP